MAEMNIYIYDSTHIIKQLQDLSKVTAQQTAQHQHSDDMYFHQDGSQLLFSSALIILHIFCFPTFWTVIR
jgi:hypothetical protein